MEGDSTELKLSGLEVAAAPEGGLDSGEEDKGGVRDDDGDKSCGGNRWPREETLTLLKIRSDMDLVFRDSTPKGPLWEDVSRKLEELGYRRSAKKCKEKFENVYKYHKRTRDGRNGKRSESKSYKFFNEIEALKNLHPPQQCLPNPHSPLTIPPSWTTTNQVRFHQSFTHHSSVTPTSTLQKSLNSNFPATKSNPIDNIPENGGFLLSSSTSSSTASDKELGGRPKRKRKWKDFFARMTKEVVAKQEGLQMKFLEALEKIEHQRVVREESWRTEEMARINKEHEMLVQEISAATAKDAAVISFLQNIMSNQLNQTQSKGYPLFMAPFLPSQPRTAIPPPNPELKRTENGGNSSQLSASRWPKAEVHALINLRTGLDMKYQENIAKGPLWEDISAAMKKLGYNRSSKRCKEKWENINKYFKKVKESNRKRSGDSKTCPYIEQLDAIYKEKEKTESSFIPQMVPLIVQPEQQWPPPDQKPLINDKENGKHNEEEEEGSEGDNDDSRFQTVKNEPASLNAIIN